MRRLFEGIVYLSMPLLMLRHRYDGERVRFRRAMHTEEVVIQVQDNLCWHFRLIWEAFV